MLSATSTWGWFGGCTGIDCRRLLCCDNILDVAPSTPNWETVRLTIGFRCWVFARHALS